MSGLQPRGARTSERAHTPAWANPGDVFVPILRRTTRSGDLAENGIQIIPWTYLEASRRQRFARIPHPQRQSSAIQCRRQARVEQLAIAVKADPAETTLHLLSRHDEKKPLVGYEVLAQDGRNLPGRA